MKKFQFGFILFISFFVSGTVFSQMPTANGNVMNFASVTDYESFTENEATWGSLRNVAQQSNTVTTLAELESGSGKDADTLYPDFLKEVLNTDFIFQIGNYLIKIDIEKELGLVISVGAGNAYQSLVENNINTPGMMTLSMEDDFGLELLEGLETGSVTVSNYQSFAESQRACRGARRKDEKRIPTWLTTNEPCDEAETLGRTYGMDNKVVYQKVIFYFSLQSKIKSLWRCTFGGSWTLAPIYYYVDTKLDGTVKYRRRCGNEVNTSANLEETFMGGGDGVLHWRAYSGGRSLSHYDFSVYFSIRPSTDRTPTPPPYVTDGPYRIVDGY